MPGHALDFQRLAGRNCGRGAKASDPIDLEEMVGYWRSVSVRMQLKDKHKISRDGIFQGPRPQDPEARDPFRVWGLGQGLGCRVWG